MVKIKLDRHRMLILSAFIDMGAGFEDVIHEARRLATEPEYYREWANIIIFNQETRHG